MLTYVTEYDTIDDYVVEYEMTGTLHVPSLSINMRHHKNNGKTIGVQLSYNSGYFKGMCGRFDQNSERAPNAIFKMK